MTSVYEGPVQTLIDELGRLPGVGPKSAQRIAFYLLKAAPEDALLRPLDKEGPDPARLQRPVHGELRQRPE